MRWGGVQADTGWPPEVAVGTCDGYCRGALCGGGGTAEWRCAQKAWWVGRGLKVCTQVRAHTHTNTHIHSLPADSCAFLWVPSKPVRGISPQLPQTQGSDWGGRSALPGQGEAGSVRRQALQGHRLRAGPKHSSPQAFSLGWGAHQSVHGAHSQSWGSSSLL